MMNQQQEHASQALCPRCGAEANWNVLDQREAIEVDCPNCGRFEVPRAEFEQAEFDIAEAEDLG